jgi:hypothetical protein
MDSNTVVYIVVLGALLLIHSILTMVSRRYYMYFFEHPFWGEMTAKEKRQKKALRELQQYGMPVREMGFAIFLLFLGLGFSTGSVFIIIITLILYSFLLIYVYAFKKQNKKDE